MQWFCVNIFFRKAPCSWLCKKKKKKFLFSHAKHLYSRSHASSHFVFDSYEIEDSDLFCLEIVFICGNIEIFPKRWSLSRHHKHLMPLTLKLVNKINTSMQNRYNSISSLNYFKLVKIVFGNQSPTFNTILINPRWIKHGPKWNT